MRILLTGFEIFGEIEANPSQAIVEYFAAQNLDYLIPIVLPVEYEAIRAVLPNLLEEYKPHAVLMLGVAQKRDSIALERIAVNINDAKLADNAGQELLGQRIIEDAPVGYWSTLPLEDIYKALEAEEIPVSYSNHAGAYLCNHVFYLARHFLETSVRGETPCGFIHLPAIGEEAPNMPLAKMIRAVKLILEVLSS